MQLGNQESEALPAHFKKLQTRNTFLKMSMKVGSRFGHNSKFLSKTQADTAFTESFNLVKLEKKTPKRNELLFANFQF